jgi:hypothetical protein
MSKKRPVGQAHISFLEMCVTVLLVLGILVVIGKWSPSLRRMTVSTNPGSSTGTTIGGTTIIPKQDNY